MEANPEILCIHYYFPPLRSPAVIRNYKIASTLAEQFAKVHILTSSNYKHFPDHELPLPDNLSVIPISTVDYRYYIGKKSSNGAHLTMSSKESKGYKFLLKIQKSFPFNLILSEGNLWYIWQSYKTAKKYIQEGNITTIYSSFGPYADHYVGYLLKKKFPHLRWIADFRDLQIEPIYKNVIWKPVQRWMERKVLAKADKVVVISEGFVKQMELYGRPTESVMRGVEVRPQEKQYDKFTIAYTGSMYFDYRNPSLVLSTIRNLIAFGKISGEDIQLLYAGRDSGKFSEYIKAEKLEDIFVDKALISSDEAKTIQNKAHINLLLTSSSPELTGVVTGKIFEYFEARNPILCLINGVQDKEIENLFHTLNAGTVVYNPPHSDNAMADFILSKYDEWQTHNKVAQTINIPLLESKYSWQEQVNRLLS